MALTRPTEGIDEIFDILERNLPEYRSIINRERLESKKLLKSMYNDRRRFRKNALFITQDFIEPITLSLSICESNTYNYDIGEYEDIGRVKRIIIDAIKSVIPESVRNREIIVFINSGNDSFNGYT